MPALKLFSHHLCPYVQQARIVLGEKSINHDLAFIDLANKPDWFLAISPLGKVPVLLVMTGYGHFSPGVTPTCRHASGPPEPPDKMPVN